MEQLQHEISEIAVFDDELGFEPAALNGASDETALNADTDKTPRNADSDEAPLVAGIDQAFLDDKAVSGVVVHQGGEIIERAHAVTACSIPYIPGLLAFREGGSIAAALETLECEPDLLCFDGSGRIHYRQAGLATHIGVSFETPAVGVIKNLLCGTPQETAEKRPAGWRTPIVADESVSCSPETVIGYAYQSRQYDSESRHINPLYVSPGHRIRADTACNCVAALCGGYKLPTPIRNADSYVADCKAAIEDGA